jgi:two-component system, NarL family, nitrate/nitrite response regulator NarL
VTNAPAVRIAISDPHPILRDGLARLLNSDQRFSVVGKVSGHDATVDLVRRAQPDVLLFGMAGAGTDALAPLGTIHRADFSVRTILLIDRVDRPDILGALQFGVRAIIPRDSPPEVLYQSIERVMTGQLSTGADPPADGAAAVRKLAAARRKSQAFGLTSREMEILREVVAGHTNKAIAERSSISENTVKTHVGSLFNKLGASNRVELALFALHHRLVNGI